MHTHAQTETAGRPGTDSPLRVGALRLEHFPGRDSLPGLVFAHGFGQTRLAWSRTARQLASSGFSGITFDARGHGESDWNRPDEEYLISQFVDDLTDVARLCPTPPVLIGASMGGLLGMFAQANKTPAPFSALVLVDITPRWEQAGVSRILGFMTAYPRGFDSLEHAADAIAGYLPHRQQRKSEAELKQILCRRPDGRWHWHWDPRLIDAIGRRGEEQQHLLLDAAKRIRVPTLLISGGRSDLVKDTHVEEFLTLVPHARHVRLENATHMVAGDANDAFTQTISDFMLALPVGSPPTNGDIK